MSTFACVIWCSRPPNSERDITDTQSRYANRKSYITMNCRRAFQIWQITDIDKKESFTNVQIIPLPELRYIILRPSVFGIRSFLLVSVSFFRLNSSRRETVTFVLAFGLEKISARLLKDSVDVITPSLANLQINIVNYLHECELQ